MGEQERCNFDNEVIGGGPLAAHFNSHDWLWSPKLDLSMSDTLVNVVDMMERTEDGVDVNSFSFDKCIPF